MKTTDFFGRQERARRNTAALVVMFAFSVVLMITALYFFAVIIFTVTQEKIPKTVDWTRLDLLALVSLATLSIIALGSLYKIHELQQGGQQIAIMLGGHLLRPSSKDLAERQLLNIVEEMALASGVAVPPVYLLNQEFSINAFAAGFTPDEATIAVSRGALDHLNRDELQGVVAHEFSHILNGDMRFNLRLIGILHGILIIGLIGYYMTRLSGTGSGSSRGKGGGKIALLGFAIMVVGYIGLFFGRIIKAAVSRQREFLADASAVQFTRNPNGIAGALKKIGGLPMHSRVKAPAAETASHLFFGSAIQRWAHSPYRTHPPLEHRIRAIEPDFDGTYPLIEPVLHPTMQEFNKPKIRHPSGQRPQRPRLDKLFPGLGFDERVPIEPAAVLAAVGAPTTQHVDYSSELIASLPSRVEDAAREPFGARCIVYALLLDTDETVRQQQLRLLNDKESDATGRETERLAQTIHKLSKSLRLPLIDIAQGTLRQLSPTQYRKFRSHVLQLIKADDKVNLFEFIVQCVLLNHLDRAFGKRHSRRVQYYSIRGVTGQSATLMSALAHVGHGDEAEARAIFMQTSAALQIEGAEFMARKACTLPQLKSALETLATCSMPIKKRLLGAATLCVAADGAITVGEAELLRAVADSLDCPIPPLLPGKLEKRTDS